MYRYGNILLFLVCFIAHTNMMTQKAILVIGYNNTRVNDVKKIAALGKEHLDAVTVLCKKSPMPQDFKAADYVIDTDLYAEQALAETVIQQCRDLDLSIIAVLPFSDQGTQLGAILAKTLNLPGANPEYIRGALDKSYFRQQEQQCAEFPVGYRPIFSTTIHSKHELQIIMRQYPDGVFLKPCQEGNNRGCTAVLGIEDCDRAWNFVEKYKAGGIIAEELILDAQEYSCDSVGHLSWLTLKFTSLGTSGKYRGENGYILPAPDNQNDTDNKLAAGIFMANLCGSNEGAYHNELFYKDGTIMAVEPNLRPAGGRIWDAAAIAFEDFNPWLCWLKSMAGLPVEQTQLKRACYVGVRAIEVMRDGCVIQLPELETKYFGNTEVVELVWIKKIGDHVTQDHRDTTDFLGYIIAKNQNAAELEQALLSITCTLAAGTVIQ